MSLVKVAGNASGTGTITIQAPNTNTNYTLDLPAAAGTIQLSGNAISGTTGTFSGTISGGSTIGVGGATPSASGAGITFPATQSASSDANTLDDYEEGSFTPVIAGSSSAGTASYSQQIGRYTKIGNRVFFQISIVWSSGTGTGNLRITSLPFTNASGTGFNPPPTLVTQNVTYTAGHFATGDVPQGQSRVDVYSCPTGGGAIADVTYDAAGDLYVSGQYFV